MPYASKESQNRYQREWAARRKAEDPEFRARSNATARRNKRKRRATPEGAEILRQEKQRAKDRLKANPEVWQAYLRRVREKWIAWGEKKARERLDRIQARAKAAMEWAPTEYGYRRKTG